MSNSTRKNKKIKSKTRKIRSSKPTKKGGKIHFQDRPDFRPNLTPSEMFKLGSFGGTYWRPIYSGVLNKNLKNVHKKYPSSWWKGIPDSHLTTAFENYDTDKNKYGVKVGTTLEFWEKKKWIDKEHPYGWVHWYCDFYQGKRGPDDDRQISRWKSLAGENGRFRKYLITLIKRKYSTNPKNGVNDYNVSPKIRQTLQHWAYALNSNDI